MSWNDWVLIVAALVVPFVGFRYRRFVARGAFALVAAIFWGAAFSGFIGWAFGLLGDPRLIFAGLPVSIVVGVFAWKRLPKALEHQIK